MYINSSDKKYHQMNDFIRGEMRRKKITQKTVADRLNIDQSQIARRLSGEVEWLAREIIIVYELLGIEKDWRN